MNDKIKQKLDNLSISSGVYIMKDKNGTVIYVGKAKNLKNRVSQYFNKSEKLPKVPIFRQTFVPLQSKLDIR